MLGKGQSLTSDYLSVLVLLLTECKILDIPTSLLFFYLSDKSVDAMLALPSS